MNELKEWDENSPKKEVSTDELDKLAQNVKSLEDDYREKKRVSSDAYALYTESRDVLLQTLVDCGKSKYFVDNIGTFSIADIYKVRVTKTPEANEQMLNYISEKYGSDVYYSMVGVNYQTINAFYNAESEIAASEGKEFNLPGVEAPTHVQELRFRKAK